TRGAGNATHGTYWSADVAFNPTTAPITVLGVTIPPSGWAQVFPVVNSSSVTLTSNATSGNLPNTTPLTLTANVTPTTAAGSVNFFDGTTLIGTSTATNGVATFTPATEPANGPHSYTASFVPTLGDIANPNTASATMISGSTSSAVPVNVGAPVTPTTGVLSADNLAPAYGATVNLTDTVSPAAAAGSVVFYDGTTALNATPVATSTAGVATLAVSNLPAGTDNVTAVFTPTSTTTYSGNTSNSVAIVVAAPAACSLTGSSCTDQQNISVTVNPGTITITTPYTSAKPFTLPALALSTDGTYLSSSAAFPASGDAPITVTSTLAGDPSWTVSVAASNLTDPAGATIASSGLGLTGGTLVNNGKFPGTVKFTDIPGHNPNGSDTNTGLGTAPQTWASSPAGDGTATMTGTLGLFAPTSTPAGTYSGTITFSVI
ncbi:MAG: Ig-like domain repeat protein, partial [Acidobacteriota bacterium]|nr:Ig-like domain repeat protein [Acidobacteriota bacterium]